MAKDNAAISPSDYMSIVVDGADQSAFGLPHFVTVTKDTKGHAIKIKLVGLIEHGVDNRIALYTMSENFETGANHVVECLHRYCGAKHLSSCHRTTMNLVKILPMSVETHELESGV